MAASPGVPATVEVARRYVAEATEAADGVRSPAVAAGLRRLATSLVDDLSD